MDCVICCRKILHVGCFLPCGHCQWHQECISDWLARRSICPLCRTPAQHDEDKPPVHPEENNRTIGVAEFVGQMKTMLDNEVLRLELRCEELQLETENLELGAQQLAAHKELLLDLEAQNLVERLAAAVQRCGLRRQLFSALSREKAPLALEAAEAALGSFAQCSGDSAAGGAVLQRAARLLDVNGSGWIEEVDFQQAMLMFSVT
eukprot:s299_g3.t1